MPKDTPPPELVRDCEAKLPLRKVVDLREGDMVDLYGDRYADPERDPGEALEFEYAVVESIDQETDDCMCVYTDSVNFGAPPDHEVPYAGNQETT